MSDQPETPPGHDPEHESLYLELVDPAGRVVNSIPVDAPVNRSTSAPYVVQVVLAHQDGCSRVIQRVSLPPY